MSPRRIVRDLYDPSDALLRAKKEAEKFRSRFDGDLEKGDFVLRTPLGTIEGTYTMNGRTITFVVEKKPAVVPGALIERVLDEFLRNNEAAYAKTTK